MVAMSAIPRPDDPRPGCDPAAGTAGSGSARPRRCRHLPPRDRQPLRHQRGQPAASAVASDPAVARTRHHPMVEATAARLTVGTAAPTGVVPAVATCPGQRAQEWCRRWPRRAPRGPALPGRPRSRRGRTATRARPARERPGRWLIAVAVGLLALYRVVQSNLVLALEFHSRHSPTASAGLRSPPWSCSPPPPARPAPAHVKSHLMLDVSVPPVA
jgi:hypothetical protein